MQIRSLNKIWILAFAITSIAHADITVKLVDANENFDYKLHPADVLPWINGVRTGAVPDEQGTVAVSLGEFLSRARKDVELAMYGVEKQTWLLTAFRNMRRAGMKIRAVVDQDKGQAGEWIPGNFTYPSTYLLPSILGTPNVVPDVDLNGSVRTSSIMHNKFVVLDSERVWTGSANFSATCLGASYNANVSVEIDSPALAEIFHREFSQMFSQRLFSSSKKQATREISLLRYRDGTEVQALFSPQDDTVGRGILPFVNHAKKELIVAMFYLTEEAVANSMIAAHRRGVKVRLIIDAVGASNQASKHSMLQDAGIDVRVENWGGKMHMKAAVADRTDSIIGSMNWTFTGNARNDENILVINKNPSVASELSDYFEKLWVTIPGESVGSRKYPRPEGRGSANSCTDGSDNDYDGLIDELDPDCQ